MPAPTPFRSVDELFTALRDERGGDVVTPLAHHLQCGALLAHDAPDDVELQLAGLVHDVASSLDPRPDGDHAVVGAALVRPLLGERVAALVAGHVEAKRHLVTVDPEYRRVLSAESTATLSTQGEAMSDAEREVFEASPMHADWTRLRHADDRAKTPGLTVPGLADWRPLVEAAARNASA